MKMRMIIWFMVVSGLILGSCTITTLTTDPYNDDVYFNPGELPPPVTIEESVTETPPQEKSGENIVISELKKNEDGSNTVSNYIFDDAEGSFNAAHYNMEQTELTESDTTHYYDDEEVKTVINNYYDTGDIDFAYRIRRFHDPYFYDPYYWDNWRYNDWWFYDSWYSPYYSYMGWGGYPYSSWYGGYYRPYGYWGYGYGYPYYYSYYNPWYGGYYSGYYSGYYHGYYDPSYQASRRDDDVRYGRRSSFSNYDTREGVNSRQMSVAQSRRSSLENKSGDPTSQRSTESTLSGRSVRSSAETANIRRTSGSTDAAVLTERRRTSVSVDNTGNARTGQSEARSNTTTDGALQTSTYIKSVRTTNPSSATRISGRETPGVRNSQTEGTTYTRPASTGTYSSPRVVTRSSSSSRNDATPRSSSSYSRTYRSSSTYTKSTGSGSSGAVRSSGSSSRSSSSYRSSSSSRSSSGSSIRSSGSSGGSIRSSGSSGGSRSSGSSGGSRSSGSSGGSRSSGSSGGRR